MWNASNCLMWRLYSVHDSQSVQEGGEYDGPVHQQLCGHLNVVLVQDPDSQAPKCLPCLGDSGTDLSV